MTEAEKIICRLYLEDLDKNHTCNEYRLLMELLNKEPCEDAISRQAAINALGEGAMVNYQAAGHDNGLVKAIDIIKGLPSAQPEMIREIRKWINSGNRGNADYFIVEKIEEIINKYE